MAQPSAMLRTSHAQVWFARKGRGAVWSIHFIRYMESRRLLTLYSNPRERVTLCANHREAGLNFAVSQGPEFPPLENSSSPVLSAFPPFSSLSTYGWDAQPVAADTAAVAADTAAVAADTAVLRARLTPAPPTTTLLLLMLLLLLLLRGARLPGFRGWWTTWWTPRAARVGYRAVPA